MKLSVKVMLMAFAMILTVTSVNAQKTAKEEKGGTIEEGVKKETQRLKKQLKLTDDQVTKIGEINLSYAKTRSEIGDKARAEQAAGEDVNEKEVRKEIQKLRVTQEEEIKAVLTPEQVERFEAIKEKRGAAKEKRAERNKEKAKMEGGK